MRTALRKMQTTRSRVGARFGILPINYQVDMAQGIKVEMHGVREELTLGSKPTQPLSMKSMIYPASTVEILGTKRINLELILIPIISIDSLMQPAVRITTTV